MLETICQRTPWLDTFIFYTAMPIWTINLLMLILCTSSLVRGYCAYVCSIICIIVGKIIVENIWQSVLWWTRQPTLIFSNVVAQRRIGGGCEARGAMTPNFEFGRDFCTMHLALRFRHPMFTRSEVILLTKTQTNRRHWKHPTLFDTLRRWVIKLLSQWC